MWVSCFCCSNLIAISLSCSCSRCNANCRCISKYSCTECKNTHLKKALAQSLADLFSFFNGSWVYTVFSKQHSSAVGCHSEELIIILCVPAYFRLSSISWEWWSCFRRCCASFREWKNQERDYDETDGKKKEKKRERITISLSKNDR